MNIPAYERGGLSWMLLKFLVEKLCLLVGIRFLPLLMSRCERTLPLLSLMILQMSRFIDNFGVRLELGVASFIMGPLFWESPPSPLIWHKYNFWKQILFIWSGLTYSHKTCLEILSVLHKRVYRTPKAWLARIVCVHKKDITLLRLVEWVRHTLLVSKILNEGPL